MCSPFLFSQHDIDTAIAERDAKIERLRARVRQLLADDSLLVKENAELRVTLEELEGYGIPIELDECGQPTNLHVITTEQINEAVEHANTGPIMAMDMKWAVLYSFNIFKCEGCGGKGHDKKFGGGRFDLSCGACAPWGSGGWIIKEKDNGMDND